MCGIVGILGNHEAAPMIVEALKRLEYRGYDSAGIATVSDGVLDRRRAMGKLANLSDLLVREPLSGKTGIGHTRWATHGAPTEANAHPHRAGRVAVVHNGIIENFHVLREELAAGGVDFETDTDTETVALLARDFMGRGLSPREAAAETVARLEGTFALCFLFEGEDDLLIAVRKGSPLAIGHGDGEMFVGSDAVALAPMTDRITYLEEGDRAVISRSGAEIYDSEGRQVARPEKIVRMDGTRIGKGGHKHFMAKEIAEQPAVLADAIARYTDAAGKNVILPGEPIDFERAGRVMLVACGTAFYACETAKYWFERIAQIPAETDIASEFRYREPPISDSTLTIFVSQSGETADTLAALRYCRGKAGQIVSVVNAPESSIARESDVALPIHAGPEIGVASTKAFSCQLNVLLMLVLNSAISRGTLGAEALAGHLSALRNLPGLINRALGLSEPLEQAARTLSQARDVLFLGRGAMYPLALEGALKLKEISYIHAEGYASGELKHGPIALIDEEVPTVVLAPSGDLFRKTVSNMQEVMARNGRVLLITDARGTDEAGADVWRTIVMPDVPELLAPLLYAIPVQLLAYHAAVAKGTDVDQPRNLAKSVTVE